MTRLLIALYSRPRRHTRIGRGSDDGGGLLLSLLPCDASRDGTTPLSAHRHLLRALYLLKTDESRAGADAGLLKATSEHQRPACCCAARAASSSWRVHGLLIAAL